MSPHPTMPTVSAGSTDPDVLVNCYSQATGALQHAINALRPTFPHGRDYPDRRDLDAAIAEHKARMESLSQMLRDLSDIAIWVLEQKGAA